LWSAIRDHRAHLEATGEREARRRARLAAEVRTIVAEGLLRDADERCQGPAFDALLDDVVAGTRDPYEAADTVLADA
jgi:LAO/AO transport system kinase